MAFACDTAVMDVLEVITAFRFEAFVAHCATNEVPIGWILHHRSPSEQCFRHCQCLALNRSLQV